MASGLAPRAKSKSLSANLAGAIALAVAAVDVAAVVGVDLSFR